MGLAYLPDGTRLKYNDYIRNSPRWQKVRQTRFEFDDGKCVVCHKDLRGESFQTHHITYLRLGRERIRDVITLCDDCHRTFHQTWVKSQFWEGKESGHWEVYSLEHTARLCAENWRYDRLISRDPDGPNLCKAENCNQLIDDYFKKYHLMDAPVIDPHDISLFIRNKRYELFFEAETRGLSVEKFLDEYYGPKVRGKNPLRQEAGRKNGPFDHTSASFHRHYSENANLLLLMEEAKHYAET